MCNRTAGQIDGRSLLAKVKRNRRRLKFAHEHGGEQMLPRVLLHMIEAARPVNVALDVGPCSDRLLNEMPHLACIVFLDLLHWNFLARTRSQCGSQQTSVERLTSAGRVEGGAIQGDLPQRTALRGRGFANVGDCRGESSEKRI